MKKELDAQLLKRRDVAAALAGYKRVCKVYVAARAERDRLTRLKRPNPVHLLLAKQKAAVLNHCRLNLRAGMQSHFASPQRLKTDMGAAVLDLLSIPLEVERAALEQVIAALDGAGSAS